MKDIELGDANLSSDMLCIFINQKEILRWEYIGILWGTGYWWLNEWILIKLLGSKPRRVISNLSREWRVNNRSLESFNWPKVTVTISN